MIWQRKAPQSTVPLPTLPYLTWTLCLCTTAFPLSLPFPPPQQLILEYHIRSHHQPTFLPPPIIALFYAQPPALDSANNPSLPFFLPVIPFTTSASYKLYPTSGGGVVILTDVATLRRAHHRPFKKYSVGNRTASGTRTRIFDLLITSKTIKLRHSTTAAIIFCTIQTSRVVASGCLDSQSHSHVFDRHRPTPRVRSSSLSVY
jgi:hypothetical protein